MSPVFLEALNMVQRGDSPARGSSTLAGGTTTAADLAAAAPVAMEDGRKPDVAASAVRPKAAPVTDSSSTAAAAGPARPAAAAGEPAEARKLPQVLSASGTGFVRRILEEEIEASAKRARAEAEHARAVQLDKFVVRGAASPPQQPSPKRYV